MLLMKLILMLNNHLKANFFNLFIFRGYSMFLIIFYNIHHTFHNFFILYLYLYYHFNFQILLSSNLKKILILNILFYKLFNFKFNI
jgi:hypothetical protein